MDCTDFRRHHLAYVDDTLPGDVLVAAERHRMECAACGAHDTLVRRSLLIAHNLPTIEPSADFSARLEARLREVRAGDGPDSRADGRATSAATAWVDGERRWYERLAPEAGGWGRQAAAAAVVLAAVSAGYALRGGREAVTVGPNTAVAPVAGAALGGGGAAFGSAGPTFDAASLGEAGTVVAAREARNRARGGVAVRDSDDFTPAYIPLPAGVLEASALLGSASAGIPVWPAALLAGEAPLQLQGGGAAVRLVGLTH